MADWMKIHEEMTKRLKESNPDKEIFWARNETKNIESLRMIDGYEVIHVNAQDAKKLGHKNENAGADVKVTCGDLIAVMRPVEMLHAELKEQKAKNERFAKEVDASAKNELNKLRGKGIKDL
jgi:hypothetical protein